MDRNTAPAARQRCAEVEIMETPEDVAAMLRLHEAGWGRRRIAKALGCSHETVRRPCSTSPTAFTNAISRIQAALVRDARVDGHGVSTCKLIANAQRRGLIKVNAKGDRYVLDRDRVSIERRRAGVHVIRSTLVEQPVARSLQVYDARVADGSPPNAVVAHMPSAGTRAGCPIREPHARTTGAPDADGRPVSGGRSAGSARGRPARSGARAQVLDRRRRRSWRAGQDRRRR